MSDEINLLNQRKQVAIEQKSIKIVRYIATTITVITILILSGILFLKVSSPLPQLKQQESGLLAQLTILHPRTAKLLFIEDRIKESASTVTTRPQFDKTIDFLTAPLPEAVQVQTADIDKKSVSFVAHSPSLSLIHSFLNYIVDEGGKRPDVKKVTLSEISYDGTSADYQFTISLDSQ